MERSASRKGPQRQETLGPSAPIWDWEVERATLRTECREYREKAEQLEEDLKKERQIYEKNTTSLLHEVKLKESVMEKKLKDLEEQFTAQLLELQKRLDEERLSRQEILQNIHAQHETALQSEEKKYQRRLASLRERLDAKDREYAEILRSQEANMSVPQTIEASDEQIGADEDIKRNESLLNEQDKSALKEGNLQVSVKYISGIHSINTKQFTLFTELEDHRKKQKEYSNRINELEKELKVAQDDSQKYKKRLDQALKTHNEEISELTEKFMSETHRTEMTFQARMQNFQTEQADIIRDLKDQYDTQQEVMQIEHAAILDEVRRNLDFEKAEAIRE
ncbi:hypothetical protein BDF20DRAFT_803141, partial [Mycotypha africana]|uniref:uncharacterized protein n=1 Tax=Mycotypha africana TaxID=64632 RepID=UPI002300F042